MYQSLAAAVIAEAAKANTNLNKAYDALTKAIAEPTRVPVSRMEDVAKAEAVLDAWTRLYLIAEKYKADAVEQSKQLVYRVRRMRDELIEDYGVQSTSPWVNAEAATARKAKVEVYAILSEFVD